MALFPGVRWWVAAVILTMPIREVALARIGGASVRIGDVVLAMAIVVWFLVGAARGHLKVQNHAFDRIIFIFVAVYACSIVWTIQYDHAWIRIFKLTRNALLYALLVNYLRTNFTAGFRRVAVCLVATGVMVSVAFMYSMAQLGGAEALRVMFEASSLLSNDPRLAVVKKEAGAGLLMRGAASWLPLCAFFGIGVSHLIKTHFRTRLVQALVVAMGALSLLTMSRAAWVGLAVGGCMFLAADRARRGLKRVALAAVAGGVLLSLGWLPMFTNIIATRFGSVTNILSDPSMEDRFDYYGRALNRFQSSPLIGGGVAGIDPAEYVAAHNVYLQVLAELGILGAALLLLLLVVWVRYLVKSRRYAIAMHDDGRRMIAAAMLGITGFFLTYFLVGHDLESSEPWIVMAVSSALHATSHAAMKARRVQAREAHVMPVPSLRLS